MALPALGGVENQRHTAVDNAIDNVRSPLGNRDLLRFRESSPCPLARTSPSARWPSRRWTIRSFPIGQAENWPGGFSAAEGTSSNSRTIVSDFRRLPARPPALGASDGSHRFAHGVAVSNSRLWFPKAGTSAPSPTITMNSLIRVRLACFIAFLLPLAPLLIPAKVATRYEPRTWVTS